MGLGEGDCNKNADCQKGLICGQRAHNDLLPWQTGVYLGPKTETGIDFCVLPVPHTVKRGNCGKTKGKCGPGEGDCDYNSDCQKGLACYQRNGYPNIPGLVDNAESVGMDYCWYY